MDVAAALTRLLRAGWEVWTHEGVLLVRHKTQTLTPAQRQSLGRHKAALLAVLDDVLIVEEQAAIAEYCDGWRRDAAERRATAAQGLPTLANRTRGTDDALVAWAQETGRLVYIGRRQWQGTRLHPASIWHNPYRMARDGTREQVIARYAAYLDTRPDLLS